LNKIEEIKEDCAAISINLPQSIFLNQSESIFLNLFKSFKI